jgi:hypothetical protein
MSKTNRNRAYVAHRRLAIVTCSVFFAACDGGSEGGSDGDEAEPPAPPELAINVAANDPTTSSPFDATPSPDGELVYYTALGRDETGSPVPGVFKVPAAGGAIETLALGAPIEAPTGITIGLNGATLYIADPGTGTGGAILSVAASGGTVSALGGTEGYSPSGVVVARVDDRERIYFTGFNPATGTPGLYTMSAAGGDVSTVAEGAPFADPGGVVVTASGDAYVADSLGSDGFSASVIKVSDGSATVFIGDIGVGFPAGITTTQDDSTVIVSGLDPVTRTDVVYFINVATREVALLTDPVSAFRDSAGLHRAHDTNVFAWADSEANATGTVYVLKP